MGYRPTPKPVNRMSGLPDDLLRDILTIGSKIEDEKGLRPKVKKSLEYWCKHALAASGLAPARHHLMLIDYLQRLADGEFDRLMVHMPPGYAKTQYVSILFIA